jgi:hypothetical protein
MTAVDPSARTRRPAPAGTTVSVVADAAAVLVFVVVGRHAHDHGVSAPGVASTAWPFLAGAAAGWLLVAGAGLGRRRGRRRVGGSGTGRRGPRVAPDLAGLGAGVVVWLLTVAIGMVLRVLVGQGTAVSFIAVALAFLGLFTLGWRALAALVARRRHRGPAGDVPA